MTSTCIEQPDKCSVQHATGNMHSATCMEQPARCNMHTAHWMWMSLTAHRFVALLCLVRLWCWLCFCLLSFKCSFNMRNAVTRLHVTSLLFFANLLLLLLLLCCQTLVWSNHSIFSFRMFNYIVRMLDLSLQHVQTQHRFIASRVKPVFIVMHNDVVKYAFDFESTKKLIVQQHTVVYGNDALSCMRRA